MTKTKLIIGGTSGIGLAVAEHYKNRGVPVIITGRRTIDYQGITSYTLDVRSESAIDKFFNKTIDQKEIGGLVYCAGITAPKKNIEHFEQSIWSDIISTNLTGAILTLKHGYPILKKNCAKIVLVSSLAARQYSKFSGIEYTTSKAALGGLVKQLAIDFAPDNILINSVLPGMTLTPMLSKNVSQEKLDEIAKDIPLGRIADLEDVANTIIFLLSSNNKYITGAGIDVNGGQHLTA